MSEDCPRRQDWDPMDPAVVADYIGTFDGLRARCPVPWSDQFGGFWSAMSYDTVAEVCRSPERFRNGPQFTVPHLDLGIPWLPLQSDAPQHAQYRGVLAPALTRRRMLGLDGEVRALARSLLGPLVAKGRFDAAAEFAQPFAGQALCLALDFPGTFWNRFFDWNAGIAKAMQTADLALLQSVLGDITGYVAEEVEARKDDPGEDFLGTLLTTRIQGRAVTQQEIVGYYLLLMSAGHNTSSDSLSHAIVHLSDHPEHRARLRAEPEILPNAVEEIVRFYSPLLALGRRVGEDTTLGGVPVKAGDQVAVVWAAAGHDTTHLPDADRFRLDRPLSKHLSFGLGTHYCVGAELGRLQLRVAIEELLAHFEDFTIAGDTVKTPWPTNGYLSIPLSATPAATARAG
jgi:cytochrome P450